MNIYLDLFLTFARVGVCTFGGGYAMLPIMQRELADNKGWTTEEKLADYYAVGQCTPGVIAVNTATFVGSAQAGIPGGVIATLGIVFPSIVIILVIATFLSNFAELPVVIHAFNGVRAGVVALILSSVIRLMKGAVKDIPTCIIYIVVLVLAALGTFVTFPAGPVAAVMDILTSPVTLVVLAAFAGVFVRYTGKGGKKA